MYYLYKVYNKNIINKNKIIVNICYIVSYRPIGRYDTIIIN